MRKLGARGRFLKLEVNRYPTQEGAAGRQASGLRVAVASMGGGVNSALYSDLKIRRLSLSNRFSIGGSPGVCLDDGKLGDAAGRLRDA